MGTCLFQIQNLETLYDYLLQNYFGTSLSNSSSMFVYIYTAQARGLRGVSTVLVANYLKTCSTVFTGKLELMLSCFLLLVCSGCGQGPQSWVTLITSKFDLASQTFLICEPVNLMCLHMQWQLHVQCLHSHPNCILLHLFQLRMCSNAFGWSPKLQ